MLNHLNHTFSKLVNHELRTAQMLFFFVTAGFTAFVFFGDNLPVKGPISHQMLNAIDAIIAGSILIGLLFLKRIQEKYQICAYVFMYTMNTVNIFLLYGTSFNIQYSYQFIVAYTISGWFFRSKKSWLVHTIIMNVLLLFVTLVSEHNGNTTFDFYATYIIASFAQAILIHFRFTIEERLKDSEKKYRLLAENSFDIICIHKEDGRMEFISPSIKRLLGYAPEELIGHRPYEIVHPDDRPIIRNLNLAERNHPSIYSPSQYRLRHAEGHYIWVETIFVPLDSEDGTEHLVLSQSRDIRRSKKYQQQLEERTKELERSNADLETFAFVSSHDMQEPLRMISNYMQLLKKRYEGKLDEQAHEYIEFANKGSITLQQLLRDLLAFSRITRSDFRSDAVNTKNLLQDVLKSIELELKDKNAVVHSENMLVAIGDRNLLQLVFRNLILNGIKYNKSEQPVIKISAKHIDRAIVFCFKDNGIGIKPEHQTRIFEPFNRLHTKNEYPGTGLGLSICKKIIDRMGGKIWIESELGVGSKFYFSLPLP